MFTLRVTNFQSIQDIELQVQGLTVLTAPSHSGKSAIVRAVDTLLTSNWYQEAYQRKGTSLTTVSLQHEGDSLEFIRKGSSTTYKINNESYGKLGRKVPLELQQAGYGEVQISESASETTTILPQLQNQFDGPYQDTIKPASLTQLLGSFTNLTPFQTGQDKAKKQQADAVREISRLQKDRLKLETLVQTFSAFSPNTTQCQLENLNTALAYTDVSRFTLTSIISKYELLSKLNYTRNLQKIYGDQDSVVRVVKPFISTVKPTSLQVYNICNAWSRVAYMKALKLRLSGMLPKMVAPTASLAQTLTVVGGHLIQVNIGWSNGGYLKYLQRNLSQVYPPGVIATRGLVKLTASLKHQISDILHHKLEAHKAASVRESLQTSFKLKRLGSHVRVFIVVSRDFSHDFKALVERVESYRGLQSDFAHQQQALADLTKRKLDLEKAATEGLCPLCFTPLVDGHANTIQHISKKSKKS